ncbi:hypothetical protein QQZ08_002956 [Neonectria magnoliae]|uniref:C2H2-type domain-containing protein n=1 Tax=Neonectria magnoliae TaxID=2732573 RepID=A0ABR1IA51_9HYPO
MPLVGGAGLLDSVELPPTACDEYRGFTSDPTIDQTSTHFPGQRRSRVIGVNAPWHSIPSRPSSKTLYSDEPQSACEGYLQFRLIRDVVALLSPTVLAAAIVDVIFWDWDEPTGNAAPEKEAWLQLTGFLTYSYHCLELGRGTIPAAVDMAQHTQPHPHPHPHPHSEPASISAQFLALYTNTHDVQWHYIVTLGSGSQQSTAHGNSGRKRAVSNGRDMQQNKRQRQGASDGNNGNDNSDGQGSEDDGDAGHPRGHDHRSNQKGSTGLFLACPFYKRDPVRHSECQKHKLKRLHHVRQHIERRHTLFVDHCPKCWSDFDPKNKGSMQAWQDHIRNDCQVFQQPEKLHEAEFNLIKQRPPVADEPAAQWYWMYETIFPGHHRPESPYLQDFLTESANSLRQHNECAIEGTIRSWLLEENMPEISADSVASLTRRVADTAYNSSLSAQSRNWRRIPQGQSSSGATNSTHSIGPRAFGNSTQLYSASGALDALAGHASVQTSHSLLQDFPPSAEFNVGMHYNLQTGLNSGIDPGSNFNVDLGSIYSADTVVNPSAVAGSDVNTTTELSPGINTRVNAGTINGLNTDPGLNSGYDYEANLNVSDPSDPGVDPALSLDTITETSIGPGGEFIFLDFLLHDNWSSG